MKSGCFRVGVLNVMCRVPNEEDHDFGQEADFGSEPRDSLKRKPQGIVYRVIRSFLASL